MITMIAEDVAVVAVIALFVWLVPVRRHGIPGLRGRGRVPSSPFPSSRTTGDTSDLGHVHLRLAQADEKVTAARGGRIEVLAEHSGRRGTKHPTWVPGQAHGHHQNSA